MAYDEDRGYWHLSLEGWKRADEEPFPSDRIETWSYSSSQASPWSRDYRSLKCVWADEAQSREERDKLRKRHGLPYGLVKSRDVKIGEPL